MTPRRPAGAAWGGAVLTAWDRALAGRTLALWLLATASTAAVLVATDEREATATARLARLCALSPALAALAIALLATRLERAGDLRALAAMGVSRAHALRAAIFVGSGVGLSAALALLLGVGSLDGLFPPLSGEVWRAHGAGFVAPGLSLESVDGAARFVTMAATEGPRTARVEVAATIALFAVTLPLWITRSERWLLRAGVGLGVITAAIVCFHAVSAGRPASLLLVPPLALLAYLVALAVRSRAHEHRAFE